MSKHRIWVIIWITHHHLLFFLAERFNREFSALPRLALDDITLRLDGLLFLGLLSAWSISLPSPLWTRPDLSAERRAELRDARSAFAFSDDWNCSYSWRTPALVLWRFPLIVTQKRPTLISRSVQLGLRLWLILLRILRV